MTFDRKVKGLLRAYREAFEQGSAGELRAKRIEALMRAHPDPEKGLFLCIRAMEQAYGLSPILMTV